MSRKTTVPQAGPITADRLIALLADRHKDDVWVPECKDGPTWTASHKRLDGWALLKTWSPWTAVGYEVKVSRSDFEQDQKWPGYLPVCHLFSFVCPTGLIKAVDLPKDIGLIWASPNGERLVVKVKPKRREVDPLALAMLMSYVLICRARITREYAQPDEQPESPLDVWRHWVEHAEAERELAHFVKGHIRRAWTVLEERERKASQQESTAEHFAEHLQRLGVHWDPTVDDWRERCRVQDELTALFAGVDAGSLGDMRQLAKRLNDTADRIDHMRQRHEEAAPRTGAA